MKKVISSFFVKKIMSGKEKAIDFVSFLKEVKKLYNTSKEKIDLLEGNETNLSCLSQST